MKSVLAANSHSDAQISSLEHIRRKDWQLRLLDLYDLLSEDISNGNGAIRGLVRIMVGERVSVLRDDESLYIEMESILRS